jgi:plasmid stabilization system protein ParE
MSFIIHLSSNAEKELEELLDWYTDIDTQLSVRFSDEYAFALHQLTNHPQHFSFIAPNQRRLSFKTLKVMLIYSNKDNVVDITSVKDMRSKPNRNFY